MAQGEGATHEDLPTRPSDLPPELSAPLARFGGERPPAPSWFEAALAQAPEHAFVPTPRGSLETLSWGKVGQPGLLFVHGNTAHAHWWSFIAPLFAADYRVTAMSLAGMGDSDWRERYAYDDFAADAEAVSQATGLHQCGRRPVYIGHSFGGAQVFYAAARHSAQLHAAILVDVGLRGPMEDLVAKRRQRMAEIKAMPIAQRPKRIYATLAAALARFRLSPPQPADNLFILDHIARHGLKRAPDPDGAGEGFAWKFDPDMWEKLDRSAIDGFFDRPPAIDMPLAHLIGEKSFLTQLPGLTTAYPANGLEVVIPQAHHHVMIDQPLALTAAIRSLLAAWRA